MQHLFSIVTIFSFLSVDAQTNPFISGTYWFAVNNDSSFFKTDTVRLIKYSTKNKEEDETSFFKNSDFITLSLEKNKRLLVQSHLIQSWSVIKKKGKYNWQFDKQDQELKLYFNGQLLCSFVLLYAKPIKLNSKFTNKPPIISVEVTLKRKATDSITLVK